MSDLPPSHVVRRLWRPVMVDGRPTGRVEAVGEEVVPIGYWELEQILSDLRRRNQVRRGEHPLAAGPLPRDSAIAALTRYLKTRNSLGVEGRRPRVYLNGKLYDEFSRQLRLDGRSFEDLVPTVEVERVSGLPYQSYHRWLNDRLVMTQTPDQMSRNEATFSEVDL